MDPFIILICVFIKLHYGNLEWIRTTINYIIIFCHKIYRFHFNIEYLDVSSDEDLNTPTIIYNSVDDNVEADLHSENMPI